jgi:hypothetical protein
MDDYKRKENGFILFTEVEAGALIGALLAAVVVYDLLNRLIAWAS